MSASLHGRRVVITGGARGIGAETARQLADAGATVVIGDLDADLAVKTAAELGILAVGERLDVADRASFAAFLDRATELAGPIDVLVNNAGIMPVGALAEEPDEIAERMVNIDLHGVIIGTKLAAERMTGRGGHVINIASMVSRLPMPSGATYSAAKAGVEAFSEAARRELRAQGVMVSAVLPAFTTTELTSGTQPSKLMPTANPQQVAAAIVKLIVRPRPVASVPGYLRFMPRLLALLPVPVRDGLLRGSGVDSLFVKLDPSRQIYEARARGTALPSGEGLPQALPTGERSEQTRA